MLFIGGPQDGRRQAIQKSPLFSQIATHSRNDTFNDVADNSFGVSVHTYDIKRLQENGKVFEVAVYSGLNNPLERLIKGYRYHRNKFPIRRRPKNPYPGIPGIGAYP